MTDAEKNRMISVVRAIEYAYAETLALKTVLFSHRIPQNVWEAESRRLMTDPDLSSQAHAKFAELYAYIEQSRDGTEELESLLQAFPKPPKQWN